MAIDIDQVRQDTPGVASVAHLNNAGAGLPPAVVLDSVMDYLNAEATVGGYETADDRHDELESVYAAAGDLLGGKPENWAFVESATRAWNAAFSSLRFKPGDKVITTKAEYPSNMAGILRARDIQGIEVVIAPDDEHGQLDVAALANMIDDRTKVVSVTHIPTQGGLINPAAEVGKLLAGTDILYQVDACQSVGQIQVNVDEIGCDILSFTGRKFVRGPRGTGMVWANDTALDKMDNPAGVDMRGATWDDAMTITPMASALRFEPFEVFFAGKVGLAEALRYAHNIGIANIEARNEVLATELRQKLEALPGVTVHDKGLNRSAIVTFAVDGQPSAEVSAMLRTKGINTSVAVETSARLDFPERGIKDLVRASVHYYNTEAEIDQLIAALAAR